MVKFSGAAKEAGVVTRMQLSAAELAAPQRVSFPLRMRHFDELEARIARGEILTVDELTERYFPTREAWCEVASWLEAQGLDVEPEGESHLTVTASGRVSRVQAVMQARFAKVRGADGEEYTSAISPPFLPESFRPHVVGVSGLQPHLRPAPQSVHTIKQLPSEGVGVGITYILPQTIAQLYNADGLGLDGRGQRIAILGFAHVNPDDLTTFWQTCGLPTTIAQFQQVDLNNGVIPLDNGRAGEETMNIEWASAMAPGADIVYIPSIFMGEVSAWILKEIREGRPINQLSCSYAGPESAYAVSPQSREADRQYYAALTAAGVTVFYASGNDGTTHTIVDNIMVRRGYDPNGVTSPFYPASIPYVTGVGGTTVTFGRGEDGTAIQPVREGAWTLSNMPNGGNLASSGGISWYFDRPAWQTAPGVPEGDERCVPDVAAVASSNFSLYHQYLGMRFSAAGTSLATPIWAGLCALINQALAEEGLKPVGLLGPKIYPLVGTPAFNQMTTGSANGYDGFSSEATNGAYKVGPGYTMITGLGTPNIEYLTAAMIVAGKQDVPEEPDPVEEPPPPPPAPVRPPASSSGGGGGGGGAPSVWFVSVLGVLYLLRFVIIRNRLAM